MLLEFVVAQR